MLREKGVFKISNENLDSSTVCCTFKMLFFCFRGVILCIYNTAVSQQQLTSLRALQHQHQPQFGLIHGLLAVWWRSLFMQDIILNIISFNNSVDDFCLNRRTLKSRWPFRSWTPAVASFCHSSIQTLESSTSVARWDYDVRMTVFLCF